MNQTNSPATDSSGTAQYRTCIQSLCWGQYNTRT